MLDSQLREHVLYLLRGGGAHVDFESALVGIPDEYRGVRVDGCPHTLWRLLEHMRICQWDIVRFCVDASHVSPEFPVGYWPAGDAPGSEEEWNNSLSSFRRDMAEMQSLVEDTHRDLFAKIPHGTGQTLLREALLVADHNSYHLGQVAFLKQCLGLV